MAQYRERMSMRRMLREFGPIRKVTREEAWELAKTEPRRVFCLIITDTERGAHWSGAIGYNLVNVEDRYILEKPVPEPVNYIFDVYNGEEGLPE